MRHSARLACLLSLCATPALAEITIRFDEGAPKDRFVIENTGACALLEAQLRIDLTGSAGGLVFDTTASGAGVQVFQPFEMVSGAQALSGLPQVSDGDTSITLPVTSLAPMGQIVFTIDVDDTIGAREITVSGAEISGAQVRIVQSGTAYTAPFTEKAEASLPLPVCTSA